MSGPLVFRNRQRTCQMDMRWLRRLTLALLRDHFKQESWELCIHLVAEPEMARLNGQFLGHPGSTDVITFNYGVNVGQASRLSRPVEPPSKQEDPAVACRVSSSVRDRRDACPTLQGELFICLDDAVAQARQFRTTWQAELVRYVIHGLLHLRDYDDAQPLARLRMKREENRLLRGITQSFSLPKLGTLNLRRGRRIPAHDSRHSRRRPVLSPSPQPSPSGRGSRRA